jgi:membrane protease YdiL (CAAX protease family)
LVPLPLIVTANAAVGKSWASLATGILTGLTSGITFLFGALVFAGVLGPPVTGASATPIGLGIMITGGTAAVLGSNPMRARIARILPIDPDDPVHALALVLAVIWFGSNVTLLWFVDVFAADRQQPPLTVLDLAGQELPFLIVAAAGVGLYMRRNATEAADRLGVVRPAWWQITLALAAAGVFSAFAVAAVLLSQTWTPSIAHNIDVTTQHNFGGLLAGPVGIAALALLPAICEETLFRGALQPRLGLVVTALLFTSIHTQYSVSFDTLAVLVLALGLGIIRKYTNTTTSAICHATFNLVASINLGGDLLGLAVGAEVVLIALTSLALWSHRRRDAPVTNP